MWLSLKYFIYFIFLKYFVDMHYSKASSTNSLKLKQQSELSGHI